MKKYKMYTLCAKIQGSFNSRYTVEQGLRNDNKRGQELMSFGRIEQLDKITATYDSAKDLLESYPLEVFGEKVIMYDPVIYVDKHITNRSKSYYMFDIVFSYDWDELQNTDNIRGWLLNHLYNNPSDINKFRGIKDIYENLVNKYKSMSFYDLVNRTAMIYFDVDDPYKRYREVYFKLKELYPTKVKKK